MTALERLGFLEPVLEREATLMDDVSTRLFPVGDLSAPWLSALGEARAFVARLIGAWRRMRDYATTLREHDV